MKSEQIQNLDFDYILPTYGRLPVVPAKAESATMVDADGKKYIDFTSGIGVNSLGWCNKAWTFAVEAQLGKFQHISNYYYCEPASILAEKLAKASGLKKMFFGNSGAEANEGAIKLARKYSYDKYGDNRSTIVTLKQSFHGRTVTTLAATGQNSFHTYFHPFTEGFKYAEAGNLDDLKANITDDVCAVMCEMIQGEGGVNVLTQDYIKSAFALCNEKDILFIADEVQTGIGRTGKMFAYQNYGILPDVITLAKGLGGGLPIGVFMTGEKALGTLTAGTHGSTFGANPISCAGANVVVDTVGTDKFLASVNEKGKYITDKILAWDNLKTEIKSIKGMGLMIGIQIGSSPKEYLGKAAEMGLLILSAGSDVVRLLPPLNITYAEIDEGLAILNQIFAELK